LAAEESAASLTGIRDDVYIDRLAQLGGNVLTGYADLLTGGEIPSVKDFAADERG
jgi:hypothetical protein